MSLTLCYCADCCVTIIQELKDFANSVDLTETFKFADEKFTYDDVSGSIVGTGLWWWLLKPWFYVVCWTVFVNFSFVVRTAVELIRFDV